MFISLYYRYCVNGILTIPMQWDRAISKEQYDLFVNARAVHKGEYDKIAADCTDVDVRRKEVIGLNYRIAEELFPDWCSELTGLLGKAYCNVPVPVHVDGCEVLEGMPEMKDVEVELGYSVSFGRDNEDEGSELIPYSTSMSRDDFELFLMNKPEPDINRDMLVFDDVARVLPKWADRVFNDIVERETVKFRKEPFYEIWGFSKDDIDAPDWKVTSIADIYITVEEIGSFENI